MTDNSERRQTPLASNKCAECGLPLEYGTSLPGTVHGPQRCIALQKAEVERLTKALRIAEIKASGTLANNLCPDHRDKQIGKPCLACEIERLTRESEAWDKASLVAIIADRDRLTVERDQLLAAIGEHVTVRSDQYALIQRLTRENAELREGGARLLTARTRIEERLRAALERISGATGVVDFSARWAKAVADAALSGEPNSAPETCERHMGKLDELAKLPRDWGERGDIPPLGNVLAKARQFAALLPAGHWDFVPGSDGSIQIEQHADGLDIELHISSAQKAKDEPG